MQRARTENEIHHGNYRELVICQKEKQAHGHPWASPRQGKKMGATWRPWLGLAQAGLSGENKMDSREAGIHFFPRSASCFFPRGKKMGSYAAAHAAYIVVHVAHCTRCICHRTRRICRRTSCIRRRARHIYRCTRCIRYV